MESSANTKTVNTIVQTKASVTKGNATATRVTMGSTVSLKLVLLIAQETDPVRMELVCAIQGSKVSHVRSWPVLVTVQAMEFVFQVSVSASMVSQEANVTNLTV